jgi:hypothetical protein
MTRQEILDEQLLDLTTKMDNVLESLPVKPNELDIAKIKLLACKCAYSYVALKRPQEAWTLLKMVDGTLFVIQAGAYEPLGWEKT